MFLQANMIRPWYIFLVFSVVDVLDVKARPTMNPKNYLMSFGYLQPSGAHGDDEMRDAVMNFQRMANLEMTGDVNNATMQMMEKPRCGVEDMIGSAVMGTNTNDTYNTKFMPRLKRYALSGMKWSKTDLTYKFVSFTKDLSIADQKAAIERAFKLWADVTPLSFTEVIQGDADILIEFATRLNSGVQFDGPGGVLAHFDDDETFTVNSYEGINLDYLAAHEFGHSLGLAHSSVPGALMAPSYQGYDPDFSLAKDDISGIQALYGPDQISNNRTTVTLDIIMTTTQRMSTPDLIAGIKSSKQTVLIGIIVGLVVGIAVTSVVIYVVRRQKKKSEVRNEYQVANSTAMQNHASDSRAPTTLGQPRSVVNSSTRSEPTYIEIDDVSNPRGIYVTTISGQKPNQAISLGYSELPPPNTVDSPYTSLQDRKIDVYTKLTTKGMHSGQKPNQAILVGYSELPPPSTADSPYTSLQDRRIDEYTKPTNKGMHSTDD